MPGSVAALRIINLLAGGNLSSAQLSDALSDARLRGAFSVALRQASVRSIISDLDAVRGVVFASGAAMNLVAADPAAMGAIVANRFAVTALASSAEAMAAVAASRAAKMAIYQSDAALLAIAASPTAMSALRAAPQYSIKSSSEANTTAVALGWTGTYLVLGVSRANNSVRTITFSPLRTGTAISGAVVTDDISDTSAIDKNVAIPLAEGASFASSATGSYVIYFGALRCDV